MAKLLRLRRGTDTQHTTFTGAEGEVTVNTTNDSLHVHDGTTAGGTEMAKADLSNVSGTTEGSINVTGTLTCDGLASDGNVTIAATAPAITFKDTDSTGNACQAVIQANDSANTRRWYIGDSTTGSPDLYIHNDHGPIIFATNNTTRAYFETAGNLIPATNNSIDLGSSSNQWRNAYFDGTVNCDGISTDGNGILSGGAPSIGSSTDTSVYTRLDFEDSGGVGFINLNAHGTAELKFIHNRSGSAINGMPNSSGGIATGHAVPIYFTNNGTARAYFDTNGQFRPAANNTYDLGASSERWRGIYTQDIDVNATATLQGKVVGIERTATASAFDLNNGNFWTFGAIAVPNPTNQSAGMSGLLRVTAAPTSFAANWKFPGGSYTAPTSFPAVAPFFVQASGTILVGNWTEGIT